MEVISAGNSTKEIAVGSSVPFSRFFEDNILVKNVNEEIFFITVLTKKEQLQRRLTQQ
jgi:hypothetical protein